MNLDTNYLKNLKDALLIEQIKTESMTMQEELDFHYQNYRKSCEALNNKLDKLIKDLQECNKTTEKAE